MGTFAVDKVTPAKDALATKPLAEALGEVLAIGGDPTLPVIDHGPTHALLGAVSIAFAQHRHLVLSPDAIWLTIAQGVAQHVRLHAEALRSRLVRHSGKQMLQIAVDRTPASAAEWAACVPRFRDALAQQIGDGRARLFECDFSTSSPDDLLVSQIVLLDVYSPYYDFWMMCVCGIPTITLTGTVEDWRRIRDRIDVIAELDLGWWTSSLAPMLDQFVRAASGDVDVTFWQRIYNPEDAYGGEIITGWITRFYPYLVHGEKADTRNYMLELPLGEPRDAKSPGLRSSEVEAAVSTARINVAEPDRVFAVALEGGVRAVHQDAQGRLVPMAAWCVKPTNAIIADLVEKLRETGTLAPPLVSDPAWRLPPEGPADVLALYALADGGRLFDGAWRLRAWREQEAVKFEGPFASARVVFDLPHQRGLAFCDRGANVVWVLVNLDELEPLMPPVPGEIVCYATGTRTPYRKTKQSAHAVAYVPGTLTSILERAIASRGALPVTEGSYADWRKRTFPNSLP